MADYVEVPRVAATCPPGKHEPAPVTFQVTMATSDTGWFQVKLCLRCGVLYAPLKELPGIRSAFTAVQEWEAQQAKKKKKAKKKP